MVYKPDSVTKEKFVVINLEQLLPNVSSVLPCLSAEHHLSLDKAYFGLAPKGVYTAIFVTKNAVSSYLTISTLP